MHQWNYILDTVERTFSKTIWYSYSSDDLAWSDNGVNCRSYCGFGEDNSNWGVFLFISAYWDTLLKICFTFAMIRTLIVCKRNFNNFYENQISNYILKYIRMEIDIFFLFQMYINMYVCIWLARMSYYFKYNYFLFFFLPS